jgi:hypothetical protein
MKDIGELPARRAQRGLLHGEDGTVTVLTALILTALVGMLAVVADVGFAYGQRRLAQNAADSAALAGAQVVAKHIQDGARTDAQVAAALASVATRSSGRFSGQYVARYVDQNGAPLANVGSGAIPVSTLGVQVLPAKTFPTFFARAIGFDSLSIGASAAARVFTVTGFDQGNPDYGPYAIWIGEDRYKCHDANGTWTGQFGCNLLTAANRDVVFRANDYQKANVSDGNPNWEGNSNTFKGFLHKGNGYLNIASWSNGDGSSNQGGNAFGNEPLDMLQGHYAAGTPVVMPLVDHEQGNGSNTTFRVVGFALVRITALEMQGSSTWRGELVAGPIGYGALPGAAPPTPGTQTLLMTRLVQ